MGDTSLPLFGTRPHKGRTRKSIDVLRAINNMTLTILKMKGLGGVD